MPESNLRVASRGDDFDKFVSIAGESLLCPDPKIWQLTRDRLGIENYRGVYRESEQRDSSELLGEI